MTTPPAMCSRDELNRGAFNQIVDYYSDDPSYLDTRLAEASQVIEDMCNRRLMPFTGLTETHLAAGVDPDAGALGLTPAFGVGAVGAASSWALGARLGTADSVRDVWVHQSAPNRTDLWTYSNVSIALTLPFGGTIAVGTFTGPTKDTGHIRFALGVFCPPGTEITVTYSGGYTLGYPGPLVEACRLETVRQLLVEMNPEMAPTAVSMAELEQSIHRKIAPYVSV